MRRGHDHASQALRYELVDRLVVDDRIITGPVEAAMRSVPREIFVPDVSLLDAYGDRPQLLKSDRFGTLSTISQPTMVAIMLELAAVEPGHRVLEIGSGTGYNAALLAHLVTEQGLVVTVDIERDLVDATDRNLESLGLSQVEVHEADGRDGWPPSAPYDRIIATAGVTSIPMAWRQQVVDGGRVLAPMSGERLLRVDVVDGGRWETVAETPAAFIPLR